ncbi:MAG: MBL fold metallo-hydrolase [Bacteroidales bacterium]
MKVTTLCENLTYDRDLLAEHGLSLLLEGDFRAILFDTGQSSVFIRNAAVLGKDLSKAESLVISHGHYDHTGGLRDFLDINKKALIYIKKEAFINKISKLKNVGMDLSLEIPAERVVYTNSVTSINNEVFIVTDILPGSNLYKKQNPGMYVEVDGLKREDNFSDEQYLVIPGNEGISIISGCSHLGIVNIINDAVNRFKKPVNYILGGFHTSAACDDEVDFLIRYLDELSPKAIGVSHCTGVNIYSRLLNKFPDKVFYNHVGKKIDI